MVGIYVNATHGSPKLGLQMRKTKAIGSFNFEQLTSGMFKTFYYDCKDDLKKATETEEQFRKRLEQEEHFNGIQGVRGCHVQLGTLTSEGTRKRQKEVDILLTVDMMNRAIRQNMDHAFLLSGDADFRPGC